MPPPLMAAATFGIAYRAMTDEDLPFIARLYASTRADEVAAMGWPAETGLAFLAQQHRAQHAYYRAANPGAEWLIVERDGAPIGRLYVDASGDDLHLIDISLLPESRNAGLGTAILGDLVAWARASAKPVTLNVLRHSPARRLYARLGFTGVGENGHYERMRWRSAG